VLTMSDAAFDKIRLHTYHLTSDTYLPYYLGDDVYMEQFRRRWAALTRDTPPPLRLSEPNGGIGFQIEGNLVSFDILRFQQVVNTLHHQGVFRRLRGLDQALALDLGSGYGALAHHLRSVLSDQGNPSTFVLLDIPEVLTFSASYLSLYHPWESIYLYDEDDFEEVVSTQRLRSFRFVLLPAYRLDSLSHLRFDLVTNVHSLQEMRQAQVERYLRFIAGTLSGTFYSWNQDRSPKNTELGGSHGPVISELLRSMFDAREVTPPAGAPRERLKSWLMEAGRRTARSAGLLPPAPSVVLDREFVCRPGR